jgi:hypothetical protein
METVTRQYSKRLFAIILFFMAMLLLLLNASIYVGLDRLSMHVAAMSQASGKHGVSDVAAWLAAGRHLWMVYGMPVTAAAFLLTGLGIWLLAKRSLAKLAAKSNVRKITPKGLEPVSSHDTVTMDRTEKAQEDRLMFFHLLTVLQREGRLMDFFSENLDTYQDDQIGAAVRSIHENCRKAIEKRIAPKAVIEKSEGDPVTIEPGFDPNTVTLTGNVTGKPPFQGVLRHRGWRAGKIELPTLAARQNPEIIAPAEVEIL